MGVKVTSLAQIPSGLDMPYFVYLLTSQYPYHVDQALRKTFNIFAKEAGKQDFVAFEGLVGEFGGEVMNAYSIDGIPNEKILPAILISTVNPHQFKKVRSIDKSGPFKKSEKVILISLRELCRSEDDVFEVVRQLIQDMREMKDLSNLSVTKTKKTKFLDALILEPNFSGVGVKLKEIWKYFKR